MNPRTRARDADPDRGRTAATLTIVGSRRAKSQGHPLRRLRPPDKGRHKPSPQRRSAPATLPDREQGDEGAGRSPGSRVIAIGPCLPGFPVARMGPGSAPTVAGSATAWAQVPHRVPSCLPFSGNRRRHRAWRGKRLRSSADPPRPAVAVQPQQRAAGAVLKAQRAADADSSVAKRQDRMRSGAHRARGRSPRQVRAGGRATACRSK